MKFSALLASLIALVVPGAIFAADTPTPDDFAQCVKITTIVFKNKNDRDPKILDNYYTPQFSALIKKGSADTPGEAPFLDADFLRLTQDTIPAIARVGPATAKNGRINVPVLLRYSPGVENTNTAVFERSDGRWMICDLVSSERSLADDLRKEFGRKQ